MITGVWMHKRAQRSSVDHQPSYESPKLRWCEYVDLEHANRMGADWPVPDTIDTEFGKFMADACPQLMGERLLRLVFLWPVKMGGVGRRERSVIDWKARVVLGWDRKRKEILLYLKEVYVYIKACGQQSIFSSGNQGLLVKQTSPDPLVNRINKLVVRFTQNICFRIDKAFTVLVLLACDWSTLLILQHMPLTTTHSDRGGKCS